MLSRKEREQYEDAMRCLRRSQEIYEQELIARGKHPAQGKRPKDDEECINPYDDPEALLLSDEDIY